MLDLSNAIIIGKGSSRICYLHPEDACKCIKVTYINQPKISKIEMKHYRRFQRRRVSWKLMARPYGFVETTLGDGLVFSLARDYDGAISKPLDYYFSVKDFRNRLEQLKIALCEFRSFLFKEGIVVRELKPDNVVFQRVSDKQGCLVLVDGVGNNQFLPFANYSRVLARRMLSRKWAKFARQLRDLGFDEFVG